MTDLPAGRELDALVAEKVMGWHQEPRLLHYGPNDSGEIWCEPRRRGGMGEPVHDVRRFSPSSNIGDAWEVVEEFASRCIHVEVASTPDEHPHKFHCSVLKGGVWEHTGADTTPLAICLAALKAVGV